MSKIQVEVKTLVGLAVVAALLFHVVPCSAQADGEGSQPSDAYLEWTEKQAVDTGKIMRSNGRVGGRLDTRILSREHSYNYKLRATWLTPEVIRATARLAQVRNWLSVEETLALVAEAEAAGDTVILVEIDPREGSGVIPRDWLSLLRPKRERETSAPSLRSRGTSVPKLRKLKGLAGVMPRDYDYDVFWVVFSLVSASGEALFLSSAREAELVVRIRDKEGRVHWPIPESIRKRSRAIAARSKD